MTAALRIGPVTGDFEGASVSYANCTVQSAVRYTTPSGSGSPYAYKALGFGAVEGIITLPAFTASAEIQFKAHTRQDLVGGSAARFLRLAGGGVYHMAVYGATGGLLELYRGDGVTLLAISTKPLPFNRFCLVEFWAKIADSGGRFTLKVDNETIIDFTGDTRNGGTAAEVMSVDCGVFTDPTTGYWTNIALDTISGGPAWLGDGIIVDLNPTGAGNTTGFTPSAGSNWQTVDDRPSSTADYNTAAAAATKDDFVLSNSPSDAATVKSAGAITYAKRVGTAAGQNIRHYLRISGTDYAGADKALPISEAHQTTIWETNPATGVAFTTTVVDGMNAGYESRT